MSKIKEEMILIAKEMYQKDLLDSIGGNISFREGNKIFVTKTGSSIDKHWDLNGDSIIETDLNGKALNDDEQSFLSKESHVHYRILNIIPNVDTVIHAHPKYLLGFACLRIPMPIVTSPGRALGFPRYIQYVKDEPAVSSKEAIAITKYFKYLYDKNPNCSLACLMPGHGVAIAGKGLRETFSKLHILENNARAFYLMQIIKSSDYYNEARSREIDNLYDSWVDIQNTHIDDLDLFFENNKSIK